MYKALIVGIDRYEHLWPLGGCVSDAEAVAACLQQNADGSANFNAPKILTNAVDKDVLKDSVRQLFAHTAEVALFYFAGHGDLDETGGFLCARDSKPGDGLGMAELMVMVNGSRATNKIVILDCCHSGALGDTALTTPKLSALATGVTVLTASTDLQNASETRRGGVFTRLLVNALEGAAADLLGRITPGSVYAHIDQSLGPWGQRPVFKTNVDEFVSLRKVQAPIELADLKQLTTLFPEAEHSFPLDPSFEPERSKEETEDPSIPPPDPVNTAVFKTLQAYARVNLLRPVDAPHMYHAAMQSTSCRLTPLGQHYWDLVAKDHLVAR